MQARTAKTSEARNLLTQLQEREHSLREAQEAELETRRKYQELINSGVPSREDYDALERKLDEEVATKKKVAAELEQARSQLTLLQHMGPPMGHAAGGMGAGNWSVLAEFDTHAYGQQARGRFGNVGADTPSTGDVDTILSEMTKVTSAPHFCAAEPLLRDG